MNKNVEEKHKKVVTLRRAGLTLSEIGLQTGYSQSNIAKILKKNSLTNKNIRGKRRTSKQTTERHKKVVKLYKTGYSYEEISERTSYALSTVYAILHKRNLTPLINETIEAAHEKIIKLYMQGYSHSEISKRVGYYSPSSLPTILSRITSKDVKTQAAEARRKRTKMLHKEIIELYQKGCSFNEISAKTNHTVGTIKNILYSAKTES